MKKIILLFTICLSCMSSVKGDPISLRPQIIDETPIYIGKPKVPARPLLVDVAGHTLTLFSPFEDVVNIELFDASEDAVYTGWLAPGQTTLTFPNTLSGEYTIRLNVGSIYYIGVIELE